MKPFFCAGKISSLMKTFKSYSNFTEFVDSKYITLFDPGISKMWSAFCSASFRAKNLTAFLKSYLSYFLNIFSFSLPASCLLEYPVVNSKNAIHPPWPRPRTILKHCPGKTNPILVKSFHLSSFILSSASGLC